MGDNVEYYEVSKVLGGADTSSDVCLSKGTDFLCSDFTVDLSTSILEGTWGFSELGNNAHVFFYSQYCLYRVST